MTVARPERMPRPVYLPRCPAASRTTRLWAGAARRLVRRSAAAEVDPDGLRPLGRGPARASAPTEDRAARCTTSGASPSTTTRCGTRPPGAPRTSPTPYASCCAAPRRARAGHPGPRASTTARTSPLVEMFPAADIPVFQISLPTLDPAQAVRHRPQAGARCATRGVADRRQAGFFTHNLAALAAHRRPSARLVGRVRRLGPRGALASGDPRRAARLRAQGTRRGGSAHPPHRALRPAVRDDGRERGRAGRGPQRHRRVSGWGLPSDRCSTAETGLRGKGVEPGGGYAVPSSFSCQATSQ